MGTKPNLKQVKKHRLRLVKQKQKVLVVVMVVYYLVNGHFNRFEFFRQINRNADYFL